MAITFVAVGTAGTGGSGNVTPAAPAGIANNDILIIVVGSRDNVAHSVDNSFAQIVQANAGANNRLSVWWKRTSGSEGTTTVTHTAGNSICSRMYAYRGCVTSGDPTNVAGSVQSNATGWAPSAAITPTVAGCMFIHAVCSQDDNTWGDDTGVATNARGGATDTVGLDNSIAEFDGVQDSMEPGTSCALQTVNGPDAGGSVQLALTPAAVYTLSGVTKDENGSVLASCDVFLFKEVSGALVRYGKVTSDGSGNYSFNLQDNTAAYCVAAFSGSVADVTTKDLQPA